MHVTVDYDLCAGHGQCLLAAPEVFGLPPGDVHQQTIDAAQRALLGWTDPEICAGRTGLELFGGTVTDLHETASLLIPERRANPGDDLLTWMVQAEFDGKKMTDDELITREYALENINQAYEDMHNGVNLRGLIRF